MTLLKIEEVAVLIGVSVKTINNWYWFKRDNPEDERAKLLPDFVQNHDRATRYWNKEDLWKLTEFRQSVPKGRNGFMGNVTQKYYRKNKGE